MSWRPHLTATSSRPQPPPRSPFAAVTAFLTSPPSAIASVSFPPSHALAPQNPWNDVPGAAQGMSSASMAEGEASDFTEVVVVRHVETSWNASRIIQGHLDAELNEIGWQQAVAVAHQLSKEANQAAMFSSDLKQAAETAQTIAKICNLPNVLFDPALQERPEAYKAFMSHKRSQQIPGSELS